MLTTLTRPEFADETAGLLLTRRQLSWSCQVNGRERMNWEWRGERVTCKQWRGSGEPNGGSDVGKPLKPFWLRTI